MAQVKVDRAEIDSFIEYLKRIPAAWGFDLNFPEEAEICEENGMYVDKTSKRLLPPCLSFFSRVSVDAINDGNSDDGLLSPYLKKYLENLKKK